MFLFPDTKQRKQLIPDTQDKVELKEWRRTALVTEFEAMSVSKQKRIFKNRKKKKKQKKKKKKQKRRNGLLGKIIKKKNHEYILH